MPEKIFIQTFFFMVDVHSLKDCHLKEINIYILAPPTIKTKVFAPQERKYSAWIGGSIFASLPDFPNRVIITQDEYNQKYF